MVLRLWSMNLADLLRPADIREAVDYLDYLVFCARERGQTLESLLKFDGRIVLGKSAEFRKNADALSLLPRHVRRRAWDLAAWLAEPPTVRARGLRYGSRCAICGCEEALGWRINHRVNCVWLHSTVAGMLRGETEGGWGKTPQEIKALSIRRGFPEESRYFQAAGRAVRVAAPKPRVLSLATALMIVDAMCPSGMADVLDVLDGRDPNAVSR